LHKLQCEVFSNIRSLNPTTALANGSSYPRQREERIHAGSWAGLARGSWPLTLRPDLFLGGVDNGGHRTQEWLYPALALPPAPPHECPGRPGALEAT
jgi:hypothetical protein